MASEFHQKAHDTLANANLQLAIFTATGRLKDKRTEAVAAGELPDYQELRTQANAASSMPSTTWIIIWSCLKAM